MVHTQKEAVVKNVIRIEVQAAYAFFHVFFT